jgi:hypothetical protein
MTETIHTLPNGSLLMWTIFVCHRPDDDVPVRTGMWWDPTDPLAIRLEFAPRKEAPRIWDVARDILADGMTAASGDGDFRVFPANPGVGLYLASPSGCAQFSMDAGTLRAFLAASYYRVPRGHEYDGVDVDAALVALLDEEMA